jgi:Subtilase family
VYAASVVLTYVGEPKDEEKLKALEDPDNGIKFLGPVRMAKPDDLAKLNLGSAEKIKLKFIVAEAEVEEFKKKVGKQATLLSEGRQNQELVDSIASVRLAIIEDFWQDTLDFPKPNEEIWWEFWLRGTRGTANTIHKRFTDITAAVGITQVSKLYVAFPERVVVHAKATSMQISSSIDLLAMIGELRKAKELASYYVDMEAADQADFVNDLVKRLILPGKNPPSVCILDWGVNRSHPLLKLALAEDDQHASKTEWGVNDSDKYQHGTGMAGLALYGCLTEVMKETGKVKLRHILESVKIMPPPPARNEPPDFGRRMQDGVALAHIKDSNRNRALCMAVTTPDHRDGGVPSLWSCFASVPSGRMLPAG